ncbi:MAG: leucyl-tRNA--protein transferase [Spirochaetaceae bacterium]|jgi:Leu/Phe-tRNA-protein transferase|nr:leucyl-tRNA--protein transferase [Spirochaetaceae bacterium]
MLKFNPWGMAVLFSGDDPKETVDAILSENYREEFCISPDFDPAYIAGLMEAGFLVMSMYTGEPENIDTPRYAVLLPKLHRERAVLRFGDLHVSGSVRRLLGQYELRPDSDFDGILSRCAAVHGDDWLTAPLRHRFTGLHRSGGYPVRMRSFGLYREGKLAAGEFGVSVGRVYTSYSGYYEENSAGTVQMILTSRYLESAGFALWDLGMPMEYKSRLGAVSLSREEFLGVFRRFSAQQEPEEE